MNRNTYVTMMVIISFIICSGPVFSGDMDHMGHDQKKMEKTKGSHQKMDNSKRMGDMIHHSTVDGVGLMYHLIDMTAHSKKMPEMRATHHLMVYLKSEHGHNVEKAKVGYLISGPDKHNQKIMAMGMGGGFGGDIALKEKGVYTIKTKALIDGKKVIDQFDYKVE